jgi:hypothetical protein
MKPKSRDPLGELIAGIVIFALLIRWVRSLNPSLQGVVAWVILIAALIINGFGMGALRLALIHYPLYTGIIGGGVWILLIFWAYSRLSTYGFAARVFNSIVGTLILINTAAGVIGLLLKAMGIIV